MAVANSNGQEDGRGPAPFPRDLVEFEPYSQNPVFEARGPGHWDAKMRERGWILFEDGVYHLWYTGYNDDQTEVRKLGYATSTTGLDDWKRHEQPLDPERWIEDMIVVKKDDTYYMFAEGRDDQAHLLTSTDKIHWESRGALDIRYTNGAPLTPGPFGTPTVFWEDDTWFLLYERQDLGLWLATSGDAKVWKHVQDEPVFRPGPGEHERDLIALNQIVKYHGRYYAYYHGRGAAPHWSTNVAVSEDLIEWKKYPGNPLLPAEHNKSSGILIHDGERFRLYTMHDRVDLHFQKQ